MTDDALLLAIREIIREEIARALPRRETRMSATDRSTLLSIMPIIAGVLGSALWTSGELFALGEERPTLAKALGTLTPKRLGKLLRRAAGVPVGSCCIERVGDSGRDGVLWRVPADMKVAVSR